MLKNGWLPICRFGAVVCQNCWLPTEKSQLTYGNSLLENTFVWLLPFFFYSHAPLSFRRSQGKIVSTCKPPMQVKDIDTMGWCPMPWRGHLWPCYQHSSAMQPSALYLTPCLWNSLLSEDVTPLRQGSKGWIWGERRYNSYLFLTSVLDGVSGQRHMPAVAQGKGPQHPWDGRLGPQNWSECRAWKKNPLALLGFKPLVHSQTLYLLSYFGSSNKLRVWLYIAVVSYCSNGHSFNVTHIKMCYIHLTKLQGRSSL